MAQTKRPTQIGLLTLGLLALGMLFSACSGAASARENDDAALAQLIGGMSDSQLEALARGTSFGGGYSSVNGINATGVGVVEVDPDIAIMSLGVETIESTVTAARDEAAKAIDAMIASLEANGIDEDDMETQYFNIQPEYTYEQVTETLENGERISRSERRLIGYRVTNTLSVTIRDLDNIGEIVDGAVTAGGDATRLNGITFTLDDGAQAEADARAAALEDALAKANLYAEKLGATRGKLVSVVESTGNVYPEVAQRDYYLEAAAADGGVPPTSIMAGSLQVRVTVQTVFAID